MSRINVVTSLTRLIFAEKEAASLRAEFEVELSKEKNNWCCQRTIDG